MKTKRKYTKRAASWHEPALQKPEPVMMVTPEPRKDTVQVTILKKCRNPRFYYASLDGERVAVEVGKNCRKLEGKTVLATVMTNNGIDCYFYNAQT
jgi:hypothetical protein